VTPIWRRYKHRWKAPIGAGIPTEAEIRRLAAAQRNGRIRTEFQADDGEPLWSGFARP
jgi:hypothetical protein